MLGKTKMAQRRKSVLCKEHTASPAVKLSNKVFVLLEGFTAEGDKRQRSIKCKNLYLEAFCLNKRQVFLASVRRVHVLMAVFVLSLRSD